MQTSILLNLLATPGNLCLDFCFLFLPSQLVIIIIIIITTIW
jgi:hypothetical protein